MEPRKGTHWGHHPGIVIHPPKFGELASSSNQTIMSKTREYGKFSSLGLSYHRHPGHTYSIAMAHVDTPFFMTLMRGYGGMNIAQLWSDDNPDLNIPYCVITWPVHLAGLHYIGRGGKLFGVDTATL